MLCEYSAATVNDKWLLELGSHVNEYFGATDANHRNDQVLVLLGSNITLFLLGASSPSLEEVCMQCWNRTTHKATALCDDMVVSTMTVPSVQSQYLQYKVHTFIAKSVPLVQSHYLQHKVIFSSTKSVPLVQSQYLAPTGVTIRPLRRLAWLFIHPG